MTIEFWVGVIPFVMLIYLVQRTARALVNGQVACGRETHPIDRRGNPRLFWLYTIADLVGCVILAAVVVHLWAP